MRPGGADGTLGEAGCGPHATNPNGHPSEKTIGRRRFFFARLWVAWQKSGGEGGETTPEFEFGNPEMEFGREKMEFGTPEFEFASWKMEFGVPKMEFASQEMEFGIPEMEFASPEIEFGSQEMEFGTPEMEFGSQLTNFGGPEFVFHDRRVRRGVHHATDPTDPISRNPGRNRTKGLCSNFGLNSYVEVGYRTPPYAESRSGKFSQSSPQNPDRP
jgi:hypothetical protein